ncbi:MAG: PKD domain-containing protein [Nitrospirae bacterium]|nr:PKD domain-containing protein [Nitrospirota bacterium]
MNVYRGEPVIAGLHPSGLSILILALLLALLLAGCEGKGGRVLGRGQDRSPGAPAKGIIFNKPFDAGHVVKDPATEQDVVRDEILVTVKEGTSQADVESLAKRLGGKVVGFNSVAGLYQIQLPPNVTPAEGIRQIQADPRVAGTAVHPVFTLDSERKSRRAVPRKSPHLAIPEGVDARHVVVKFVEGTAVRLREGDFVSEAKADLVPLEAALGAFSGISAERHFSQDETAIQKERTAAESFSDQSLPDLNLYYSFKLSDSVDPEAFINALSALDVVEVVYFEPVPEPAHTTGDNPPQTPDFFPKQGYLNPAPQGVDALHAWTIAGGKGDGITIYDVEGAWATHHEDLDVHETDIFGTPTTDPGWLHHGTAVHGEMVGLENGYGIKGIVPKAKAKGVSVFAYGTASAISLAASKAKPGDLILIELHAKGPSSGQTCTCNCGQFELIAMEYWQATFDAIQVAVAKGVVVVEAAGNGSMNLDNPIYGGAFDRAKRDSGAILVGAGDNVAHAPECWTNHGSRVDVQGWGRYVFTTGYGDAFGGDSSQLYTNSFGGTSSASPIVTGSAAALEGIFQQKKGTALLPADLRKILVETGTPQSTSAKNIGPLPNLKAAAAKLDGGQGCSPGAFPNDPNFQNCDPQDDWGYTKIDAIAAWKTPAKSSDIAVAILDTGVQSTHPEFQGRMLKGKNFVTGGDHTEDGHGHGTHVAGTAAAKGHNALGMAGGCWDCKILPVKVLGDTGSGSYIGILNGITYAADAGARVINMSLGGGRSDDVYNAFVKVIDDARNKGAVVIVAAGNNAGDASLKVPAAVPSAVTVAATGPDDTRAYFSNYGSVVDLAAPGVNIWATVPTNGYRYMSGTSMATPMVSGVVGCIASRNPQLTVEEIESILVSTADKIATDKPVGAGRINLGRACAFNPNHPPVVTVKADPASAKPGATSLLTATAADADGDPMTFAWSASAGTVVGAGASATWTAPQTIGIQTAKVTVSDGNYSVPAEVSISVLTGEVFNLVIRPGFAKLAKGASQQFSAEISDEVGRRVTDSVQWSVDGIAGTVDPNGLFAATQAGEGHVKATYQGHFNTAKVSVNHQLPTCSASAQPLKGHVPLTVNFSAISSDPDGKIVSTIWLFGDGGTTTTPAATHTYATFGNYTATFTATDDDQGTCVKEMAIVVEPPNRAPTCEALATPQKGKAPLTVSFATVAKDVDGTLVSYAWSFADGGSSALAHPKHVYTGQGSYKAIVTVKDDDGTVCVDDVLVNVDPPNTPPAVSARIEPGSGDEPLAAKLTATASDLDGTISSYAWNTGDGGTFSQSSFSYTYKRDGIFTAKVTVTDNDGATASAAVQVTVHQVIKPPTCTATASPTNGKGPLAVGFNGSATDPDGSIQSTVWTFGDGASANSPAIQHIYHKEGAFTALFRATDNDGASCEKSFPVNVHAPNIGPQAFASADPYEGTAPLFVNFVGFGVDPDGTIMAFHWDFGDGTTSALQNPNHVYNQCGSYTAKLTVTDNDGATGSTSLKNAVQCSSNATASDWPMFQHDAFQTGRAVASITLPLAKRWVFSVPVPTSISPTEWTAQILSPSAAEKKVFIASKMGLHALDTNTGKSLWHFPVKDNADDPTPAYGDGRVYFTDGKRLYAVSSADGSIAWTSVLGTCTESTSPVFESGVVYIASCEGTVFAFDAKTGAKIWTFVTPDGSHFMTPWAAPMVASGRVFAVTMGIAGSSGSGYVNSRLHVIDAKTGKSVKFKNIGDSFWASASFENGMLYLANMDGKLYAVDLQTLDVVWQTLLGGQLQTSPAITEKRVFVASTDHFVYAVDKASGKVAWKKDLKGQIRSSIAAASQMLFVGSSDNSLYVLQQDSGDVLYTHATGGMIWSSPAIAENMIFIGSEDGKVYAFGTGGATVARVWPMFRHDPRHSGASQFEASHLPRVRWALDAGNWVHNSVSLADDGTAYFVNFSGVLKAVAPDGKVKWENNTIGDTHASPTIAADGTIYVTGRDNGNLFAFSADGSLRWKLGLGDPYLESSPVILSDGTLVFGGSMSAVYAVFPDGKLRWKFTPQGVTAVPSPTSLTESARLSGTEPAAATDSFYSSPALDDQDRIYIGGFGGTLYALSPAGDLLWSYGAGAPIVGSPTVTPDGRVAVISTKAVSTDVNRLHVVDLNGKQVWKKDLGGVKTNESVPAVDAQGRIVVNDNNALLALDASGREIFRFDPGTSCDSDTAVASPTMTSDGRILFKTRACGSTRNLYAIKPDGIVEWQLPVEEDFAYRRWDSSPSVGEDGTIYLVGGMTLVAIYGTGTNQAPTCAATADPTSGVEPLDVKFAATASDPEKDPLTYAWDYGDGSTGAGAQAAHKFAAVGTYAAVLTVTDALGAKCQGSVQITVNPNRAPVCAASATPTTGAVPLAASFLGSATDPDGGTLTYAWTFGDGSSANLGQTQHTYAAVGLYNAQFKATDPQGASCSNTVAIAANPNRNPVCSASATPLAGIAPLSVAFSGTASDADGVIKAVLWTFGDGSSSGSAQSTHAYSVHGAYTAEFRADDDKGGVCHSTVGIQVDKPPNKPPTCSLSVSPQRGKSPLAAQFASAAADTDGSIVSYEWTFGDGTPGSNIQNPSHAYILIGTFTASLTVRDNEGAPCMATGTVTVLPPNKPPAVSIQAVPERGPEPLLVQFKTTASDPDGTIVSYAWTLGDGATSTGVEPSHSYQNDGAYTATLTVKDDDGASASASAKVTVERVLIPPTCSANATPLKGHAALNVSFNGSATDADGSIVVTGWTFGDGTNALGSQVSHVYPAQGTYTAVFKATDNDGMSCDKMLTILVEPPNKPPVAVIFADPVKGFAPLDVGFKGDSSFDTDGTVAAYAWDFADGATAATAKGPHSFTKDGVFNVKLTVTDDDGATGTSTLSIEVLEGDPGDPYVWPMFGASAGHTSYSPAMLPAHVQAVWKSAIGNGGFGGTELNVKVLGPAVSDGLLFTTSLNELVMQDALTGKDFYRKSVPYASDDPTPAVANGKIVFTTGNELYAFDLATRKLLWGPVNLATCSDSTSPTLAEGVVYIAGCDSAVYAFALADGRLKWKYSDAEGQRMNTPQGSPTVYRGLVYQPTLGIPSGQNYVNPKVLVLDASTGVAKAAFAMAGSVWSAPSAKYDTLFVADQSGALTAFDVKSRATRWQFRASAGFSTSPSVVRGRVVVGAWDKNVYGLDAFSGQLLWQAATDGEIRSNAAVTSNEAVMVTRPGTVFRLNMADGSQIESIPLDVEVWSSPALAHSMIYIGATDGRVYALGDPAKQTLLAKTWTSFGADSRHSGLAPTLGPTTIAPKLAFNSGGGVNGSPVLDDAGNIYVATASGVLYGLERDGTVRWTYNTGLVLGSPTVDTQGNVFAASQGGIVHKFNARGQLQWTHWVANTIQASPCVGPDGSAYIGDNGGNFFGIDPTGSRTFKISIGDAMRNACAVDEAGSVYVGGGDASLRKFSPSGSLLFSRSLRERILSTPAIAENGTIIASTYNSYTYALSSGGGLLWWAPVSGSVSTAHGRVYIQSSDGLHVYTVGGVPVWTFGAPGTCSDPIVESPAVDIDGNVYFKHLGSGCGGSGTIYALDPDGKLHWSQSVPGGSRSSPSLGRGRALYIGSGAGLHIFGSE